MQCTELGLSASLDAPQPAQLQAPCPAHSARSDDGGGGDQMLLLDPHSSHDTFSCRELKFLYLHPCIKGKFPQGEGGGNNRTFAFSGRILVPAAVSIELPRFAVLASVHRTATVSSFDPRKKCG